MHLATQARREQRTQASAQSSTASLPASLEEEEDEWQLRLHNDDIHTFEEVTRALMGSGINRQLAFALTMRIDKEGSVVIRSGDMADVEPAWTSLRERGLIVSIARRSHALAEARLGHALKWLSSLCVVDAAFAAEFGSLLLAPAKPPADTEAVKSPAATDVKPSSERYTRWARLFGEDLAPEHFRQLVPAYADDFEAVVRRSGGRYPFPRIHGFTPAHVGASARAAQLLAASAASAASAETAASATGLSAAAPGQGAGGERASDLEPVDNLLSQLLRVDALLPKAISQELHKLYLSTLGDVSHSGVAA